MPDEGEGTVLLRGIRKDDGERGAAAVEFALVVPVLLIIVFGIIDFGVAINRWAMVNNAAREGVRAASLSAEHADVVAAANRSMDGDDLDPSDITLTCESPTGAACASWSGGREAGGVAIVEVTYVHEWLTPLGPLFGDQLDISKQSRMRIE